MNLTTKSYSPGKYFAGLQRGLEGKDIQAEHNGWMDENSERIEATVDWFAKFYRPNMKVAEIGPGGVGLAIKESFGDISLDAYDCVEWFKPVYDQFDVEWDGINLNEAAVNMSAPRETYDVILLCEVIEHIARWPVDVLKDLGKMMNPGGVILVTTQNLHRASNRLRMILGKRLFADFTPESLVMGHIREYTPEEMGALLEMAGFDGVEGNFACFPDLKSGQLVRKAYSWTCDLSPRMANHFFVWGTKK